MSYNGEGPTDHPYQVVSSGRVSGVNRGLSDPFVTLIMLKY